MYRPFKLSIHFTLLTISDYLSTCPPIYMSTRIHVYLSSCLPVNLFTCPPVYALWNIRDRVIFLCIIFIVWEILILARSFCICSASLTYCISLKRMLSPANSRGSRYIYSKTSLNQIGRDRRKVFGLTDIRFNRYSKVTSAYVQFSLHYEKNA